MGLISLLLSLLGLALVVVWAAFTFGWPAGCLAAGVDLLVIAVAASPIAPHARGPVPVPDEGEPSA